MGNIISKDALIQRLAQVKASGLQVQTYVRLMGVNKNYVYSARQTLRAQYGMTDDEINAALPKFVDAYRSWMDGSPETRDDFVALYSAYLERDSGVSEHQFCNDNGIGDFQFRIYRTGYKYFTDIFDKLSPEDQIATINTGVDGPIHFVVGSKKQIQKIKVETNEPKPEPVKTVIDLEDVPIDTDTSEPTKPVKAMEAIEKVMGPKAVSETMYIDFTRYDGDDMDRYVSVSVPFDINHVHEIFESIADVVFAFMTAR